MLLVRKIQEGLHQGHLALGIYRIMILPHWISLFRKRRAVMLELVQGEGGVNPADQAWLDQPAKLVKQMIY